MPTSDAWEQISTITLSSNYPTVTFSSIPTTYEVLMLSVTNKATSGGRELQMRLNSDSGSNYKWSRVLVEGNSSITAEGNTSTTYARIGDSNEYHSSGLIYIPNYKNTSVYKTAIVETVVDNTTRTSVRSGVYVNTWASTAAVSSISIFLEASVSHATSSVFSLYGLKG